MPSSHVNAANRPFIGLLDSVIVGPDAAIAFDGAIGDEEAVAVWKWMLRDLSEGLDPVATQPGATAKELEAILPELVNRARQSAAEAAQSPEAERRLKSQLGGDEGFERLPAVLYALKSRGIIEKAQTFGRAVNNISDDSGLALALQSMPLQDPKALALLMQAAVGQIVNPTRLVITAIRIAGNASEAAMARAGFGPLIDAILSHAQSQLPLLRPMGMYADMDLICRAMDRFNKLIRSINGYVELSRGSRWAGVVAGLTKSASEAIEPKLRGVTLDVNQALRRPRDGADRLDEDKLLDALSGVYLLVTVRECRDSLALNALFDQAWSQTGQALEAHLTRNLDIYRENPGDSMALARLDAGIKMAELRFNADYADVLRRARDAASRVASPK
jgi:hypothetical protein